jgi:hypothetical protein
MVSKKFLYWPCLLGAVSLKMSIVFDAIAGQIPQSFVGDDRLGGSY